jgi:hypothetical protein
LKASESKLSIPPCQTMGINARGPWRIVSKNKDKEEEKRILLKFHITDTVRDNEAK